MSIVWQAFILGPGSRQDSGRPPDGRSETGGECVSNISTQERRKRLAAGLIQFIAGLAVLAALVVSGADRWWRLPLLLVFWGAASGFFQWRDKT